MEQTGFKPWAAVGIVFLTFRTLIVLQGYAANTKKIAEASVNQTENSQLPFLAVAMKPTDPGGRAIENQGFGPALNISFTVGKTTYFKAPLAKGDKHHVHNQVNRAVGEAFEIKYESLSGLKIPHSVTWKMMELQRHNSTEAT